MSSVRPNRSSAAILAFAPRQSLKSSRDVGSEQESGQVIPFPRRDVAQFYATCPDVWRAFLIYEFGDDEVEVAQFYRVSPRAARKWLDGDGSARLDKMLLSLTRPGALEWWIAALPALDVAARRAA